jgi:hypothetical protein
MSVPAWVKRTTRRNDAAILGHPRGDIRLAKNYGRRHINEDEKL